MMQLHALTDTLNVSPQIAPHDLARLATLGFRSVINNRPDDEEPGQPASATLAAAADAAGLAYRHQPVVSGQLQDTDAEAFAEALSSLPRPTLAFCRTGTRSASLWALQAARHEPVTAVLDRARAAGYDLASLTPRLNAAKKH